MGMSIQLDLSDNDLEYFNNILIKARTTAALGSEKSIIEDAEILLEEIENKEKFPPFITERFKKLHLLISMLKDSAWELPESERTQALNALAYFVDSYDLIPDDIPGLGYFDDAIMIELAVTEIAKEFKSYCEFDHFREMEARFHHKTDLSRKEWEEHNRVSMYQRMRNRRVGAL